MTARRDTLLPLILAFAAGYVEAICFIGLFRTFATFITGTLMVLVIELVESEPGYLNKAVVFFSFFACTLLWVVLCRAWSGAAALRVPVALFTEALLILLFMALGMEFEPLTHAASLGTLIVSVAAVFAMSLHSTIFFVLLKNTAPTHFMTGNLTNFTVGLVDMLRARRGSAAAGSEAQDQAAFNAWHFPSVISAFVVGVGLGAAGFEAYGFVVLAVPALAVGAAAFYRYRRELAADTP